MRKLEFTKFKSLGYMSAEAMNTLCTNISFLGNSVRRIMITSCHAAEGKSYVALNVMRTLASLGKRVILVDADIRRSAIAVKYGVRGHERDRYGLTHYLAGMRGVDDIVYETDIPGAYYVPVGRVMDNSLPLLTTSRFSALMSELAGRADHIIVDAPPVGVIIDAAEIAKSCDGTLLVVQYNSVRRKELRDVKRQIEQTGCPILGTVLNGVDLNKYSNRKYYYKSYYASYESEYTSGTRSNKPSRP